MLAWAVVVAGGSGARFGAPKQFAELAGRPVLAWSLEQARRACSGVVLVLPGGDLRAHGNSWGADVVVPGGPSRSASVRAGLAQVPEQAEVIVVHDAARPLAGAKLWEAVLEAVKGGADGAVPAVPISDTIRRRLVDGGSVTVDRSELVAVQTPQAFRADILRQAHAGGADATDDAGLVEATGGRVVLVEGEPDNLKITTPADLLIAAALLGGSL